MLNPVLYVLQWVRRHHWLLLLIGIFALLVVSPLSEIYDRQDNIISPLTALVILAVTLGTGRKLHTLILMTVLTLSWLVISLITDGSGLFAGQSILAPALFLVVIGAVFFLLANWLIHVTVINAEVLCAAVCGYLIVGLFWTGIYALIQSMDAHAFASSIAGKIQHGDLLYFSYTTLTTTGFGDFVPRNPVARMWSVIEAVIGTFYNGIVIARFVTLYGFKAAATLQARD